MSVSVEDWRALDAGEIVPLLDAEAARWRRDFSWNVTRSWRVIEPARAAGILPGFVARGRTGAVEGWTWFLEHRQTLQVGAFVADDPDVVRALVDAVVASPAARANPFAVWLGPNPPSGLDGLLRASGLDLSRYLYLRAPLAVQTDAGIQPGRRWQPDDLTAAANLFARAYADSGLARAFAPGGSLADWSAYLRSLLQTDGCGVFLPEASGVTGGIRSGTGSSGGLSADSAPEREDRLDGAVITTVIDDTAGVAHLAQIAVDPGLRGCGRGRWLLEGAMSAAVRSGCRAMTLLVAEGNHPARALYRSGGFETAGVFLVAATPRPSQPRRSTSVAPPAGGVSTLR